MDLRFFVARKGKKEIYSMETIVNIILLPWTLVEWAFSLLVWYIVISWTWMKLFQYGIDGDSIKEWVLNTYDEAREALKFRSK